MLRPAVPQLVCRLIAFLSGEAFLFCSQIVNSQIGSLSIRALYLTDLPHTALSVWLSVCVCISHYQADFSINTLPEASVVLNCQLADAFYFKCGCPPIFVDSISLNVLLFKKLFEYALKRKWVHFSVYVRSVRRPNAQRGYLCWQCDKWNTVDTGLMFS